MRTVAATPMIPNAQAVAELRKEQLVAPAPESLTPRSPIASLLTVFLPSLSTRFAARLW